MIEILFAVLLLLMIFVMIFVMIFAMLLISTYIVNSLIKEWTVYHDIADMIKAGKGVPCRAVTAASMMTGCVAETAIAISNQTIKCVPTAIIESLYLRR